MTVEDPKLNTSVNATSDMKKKDGKKDVKKEELSEEDQRMKEEIETLVEQLKKENVTAYLESLTTLKGLIQTATSSMTSVPRPLKFLRPHFRDLQRAHTQWTAQCPTPKTTCLLAKIDTKDSDMDMMSFLKVDPSVAEQLADILSVLGMTFDNDNEHPCLRYCVQGTDGNLTLWGHEYLRHLSSEMLHVASYSDDSTADLDEESIYFADLEHLAQRLLPELCKHHAYMDAADLAVFFELRQIVDCVTDMEAARKMAAYLCASAHQLLGDEQLVACDIACHLYLNANDLVSAFGVYLAFDQPSLLQQLWQAAYLGSLSSSSTSSTFSSFVSQLKDDRLRRYFEAHPVTPRSVLYQMAFEATRKYSGPAPFINMKQLEEEQSGPQDPSDTHRSTLKRILQNADLSRHFLSFAKELEILEAKHPDDIYKSHLEHLPKYASASNLSDTKHAFASAFVNGFLNAGFLTDKLINDEFIYKHRDMALVSVCASAGLIRRWDMDALADLDRYIASDDPYIRAGGLLGVGLISCGLASDYDAALYLLTPFLEHARPESLSSTATPPAATTTYASDAQVLMGVSAMALSLSYMGSGRQELLDKFLALLQEPALLGMETKGLLVLAAGMVLNAAAAQPVFVQATSDVTHAVLDLLHGLSAEEAASPYAKWMVLGWSLLYLGQGEALTQAIQEALRVLPAELSEVALLTANACAFAASGDVEEVRLMMEKIMECEKTAHRKETSSSSSSAAAAEGEMTQMDVVSSYAILAMALMAMREEVGREMVMRLYRHLMHEGDRGVRRAVPLGIALLHMSHPTNTGILDLLSKYTHDADRHVAQHAVFALGLVGAGTNNARIGQMLRQLVAFYHKDASTLFVLRLAQGLVYLGKGMLTLSPYHAGDRMNWSALSGLLIVMYGMLGSTQFLTKHPTLVYYLVAAMYPRFCMTLDEQLQQLNVSVRVGQAVDTVGQAGQRKTITGWQTHLSPVLINIGERAEMATEEYWPQSTVLENFVICKKNPDYVATETVNKS